ncbi:MAG: guanylate kinase [Algisphaera sp.]
MTDTSSTSTPARGALLILSGPSGVGKGTLTKALLTQMDADLSVSMTTRPMTKEDVDGVNYFFVNVPTFERAIKADELLEYAVYAGNFYGTPRSYVEEQLAAGHTVIVEIDVEGARQVKQSLPESFALFIKAPSEEVLLERLRGRQREDEVTIQKRFSIARKEVAFAESTDVYDAFLVNDNFDQAVTEIRGLVEKHLAAMVERK